MFCYRSNRCFYVKITFKSYVNDCNEIIMYRIHFSYYQKATFQLESLKKSGILLLIFRDAANGN